MESGRQRSARGFLPGTLRAFSETLGLQQSGKLVAFSVIVGVVAGIGAIAFDFSGQVVRHYAGMHRAGYAPEEAAGEHSLFHPSDTAVSPWMLVVVITLGGLASGTLVYTFAPEAEGHGTDAAIDAFHNKRGRIRARVPLVKTVASIITLGTGGSGGREGPIAQIGAGFGAWLGDRLHLSSRDRRIMLAAGMGAGVGAIFRAPLAGAVFAGEILYSDADLEADALVPAATASIVAYSIYTQSLPTETRFVPLFGTELNHTFSSPLELLPYSVLAILLAFAGGVYVKTFYGTQALFKSIPIKPHFKPAVGAALAGLLALALLRLSGGNEQTLAVLGTGYGSLQIALTDAAELGMPLLIVIGVMKILTTSLTISSGGSGGVFGPSMVIGGVLGASVGLALQRVMPAFVPEPESYAVVGMAGFFAGVARAPLSTIIMVRAMTGDFGLLVPTMLVTTMTFVFSRRWTLYTKQVPTRLESPAHRGDFIVDVLEGLRVRDVFERDRSVTRIAEGTSLSEIVHLMAKDDQHYFPVVDDRQRIVGIFTDDDVRSYLFDDQIWNLVVARDVMVEELLSVTLDDDLNSALRRFTTKNLEELPVVSGDDKGVLLGMLSRKSVIAAYNRKVIEHKRASEEEHSA